MQTSEDCDDLAGISWEQTQKLGIVMRKSNDPEHLDAYSGDSTNRKSTSGGMLNDRVSNIARVHEGSELSNVIDRRERALRCGDDDGRGTAPATTFGILGNAG